MRRLGVIGLALVLVTCDGGPFGFDPGVDPLHDRSAYPRWVEWPAEIQSNQPFVVRAILTPQCLDGRLDLTRTLQDPFLTLQAEWVDLQSLVGVCDAAESLQLFSTFDALMVGGPARTIYIDPQLEPGVLLGSFAVVETTPIAVTRGAGIAHLVRDPQCPRIIPAAAEQQQRSQQTSYQFQGTSESTGGPFWAEGYITRESTSCQTGPADTLVFHLTAERFQPFGPPD